MSYILRHGLVLFQFSEEYILVEFENFFHVSKENVLFGLNTNWRGSGTLSEFVEETPDTKFEIFDVSALCLKQLGHDEPKISKEIVSKVFRANG